MEPTALPAPIKNIDHPQGMEMEWIEQQKKSDFQYPMSKVFTRRGIGQVFIQFGTVIHTEAKMDSRYGV